MDQLLSAIYATIHSMPRNHSSKKAETDEIAEREWIHLLKEVGIREEDSLSLGTVLRDAEQPSPEAFNHKSFALTLIAGGFAAFNVFALASLYPVLRGRGAPYLPTKNTSLDKMFAQLRADKKFQTTFMGTESHTKLSRPNFADLGSGDGRVVFRAAREGLFSCSQGYEINPMLHGFAQLRKLMTPKYWRTTNFYLGDIWKVDLTNVDVVAVYGLSPMMKDLGQKLKKELKPGSYVLSNVFAIPNWKPIDSSSHGMYIYRAPECWSEEHKSKPSERS